MILFVSDSDKDKNITLLLLLMPGTLPGKEQRVPPSRCFLFALIIGAGKIIFKKIRVNA
jgi:hypothetical protein